MSIDLNSIATIFFAFISGVVPALIWLFFWSNEDKENPEPKSMITLAFLGGMVAVFISLFFEKYLYSKGLSNIFSLSIFHDLAPWFNTIAKQNNLLLDKVFLVIIFAPIIEELTKFILAYILVLRSKEDDEPLDPMIYMITTALGFAAIENMLFLINLFEKHDFILTIFTGNMRFVGAMLLHTVSSAMIGLFMSFHFFDKKIKKSCFVLLGIILAIIMHGTFNYLMIGGQNEITLALELIWITVIIILLAFEKIKKIRREKIN